MLFCVAAVHSNQTEKSRGSNSIVNAHVSMNAITRMISTDRIRKRNKDRVNERE